MAANSPRVAQLASLVQAENVFKTVLREINKMLKVIEAEGKQDKTNLDWCNDERTENDADLSEKEDQIDTLEKEIDELVKAIDDPESGLKASIANTEKSLRELLSRVHNTALKRHVPRRKFLAPFRKKLAVLIKFTHRWTKNKWRFHQRRKVCMMNGVARTPLHTKY